MKDMTAEEVTQFLMEGTRTGKLATVQEDGRPHVVPIWYLLDGDNLIFTTWHDSVKGRNLQRDPRAAMCVDDENPPYAFVMVEGEVILTGAADQRAYWAREIAARYMGEELADEYGERNSVEGELVVRLKMDKVIAKRDVAD